MAMTPEEKQELTELKRIVRNLQGVTDVPFIENAKRRIAEPFLGDFLIKDSTGTTSGTSTTVNEGGVDSYGVAKTYNGTITIEDADGNRYKLGYYTA